MASGTQSLGHDAQRSRKQLEFNKAMSDFKSMFPSIDYDVIEIVLRANNGLVDATVDQLLSMQGEQNETENTLVDLDMNVRLPGYHDSTSSVAANEPPPAYTPRVEEDPNFLYDSSFLGPQFSHIDTSTSSYDTPTSYKTNGWNPPLLGALPKDFLRLSVQSDGHFDRPSSSRLGETSTSSRNHEVKAEALPNRGTVETPVAKDVNPSAGTVNVSKFDAIPMSESQNNNSECKHKSKRFGQMSRKFKRKKSKSAKNNYQPISNAHLIDEDDEQEKNDRR